MFAAINTFSTSTRIVDPYFNYVTLLLSTSNLNTAKNSLFVDTSSNNVLVTSLGVASGEIRQGTFTPFSPTGWSIYFAGANNYISSNVGGAVYNPGNTGEWTLECWIYPITSGAFYGVGGGGVYGNSIACYWNSGTLKFSFLQGNGSSNPVNIVQSTTSPAGAWYHYAVSKDSSNVIRLFINGVQVGTQTYSSAISSGNRPIINGVNDNNGLGNGGGTFYISNLRWVKGGCLYPASTDFTPSTTPLTASVSVGTCYMLYAQSNRFLDITNTSAFSTTGTVSVQPFGPFVPTSEYGVVTQIGWSVHLHGSSSLSIPASTAFDQNSGNWTVECWVYPTSASGSQYIYATQANNSNFLMLAFINGQFKIDKGSVGILITSSSTYTANAWYHAAYSYDGTSVRLFVNGTLQGTASPGTLAAAPGMAIGEFGGTAYFTGYISNVRVVKGVAVYTLAFTPSITPLTATQLANVNGNPSAAITGTQCSLLTAQSGSFEDNGGLVTPNSVFSTWAISNGNPSVQERNPFTSAPADSLLPIGGSGYFNGTSSGLYIASTANLQFNNENFTIQCWVYRLVAGVNHTIAAKGASAANTGWVFKINSSNQLSWTDVTTNTASTTTIPVGAWTHVAVCRSQAGVTPVAGSTHQMNLFINGASAVQFRAYTNYNQTDALIIGIGRNFAAPTAAESYFNGYISGLEYIRGTALYTTSTYTIPTAAPTRSNNPTLLLNFTNSGIYDASTKNNIQTVGAKVSTTRAKWGTTSIGFNGVSDYLRILSSDAVTFGSGNWTFEFWIYVNAWPASTLFSNILDQRPTSTNGVYPNIALQDNGTIRFYVNSVAVITSVAVIAIGSWYHVALSKSSTSTRLFIDGTQSGSTYTDSNNYLSTTASTVIGASSFNLGNGPLNGYLDDVRLTKGIGRYTTNFSPLTTSFTTNI